MRERDGDNINFQFVETKKKKKKKYTQKNTIAMRIFRSFRWQYYFSGSVSLGLLLG